MLNRNYDGAISFPIAEPPALGALIEVVPGILWARIPLPFRLNHVNVYLIEDGDGWAVLDTGIGDEPTQLAWEALIKGPLAGCRLTRLIVTHSHPDHIGLAGWLCQRFDIPLLTTTSTYYTSSYFASHPGSMDTPQFRSFFQRHGMPDDVTARVTTEGYRYLEMVTPLPATFCRLVAGEHLKIGGRDFEIYTGDGHAPEQLMLYCAAENLFLVADQVLTKISPNISVWANEPDGDPLGLYLRALSELRRQIPSGALILPGHQLPFYGLHERCEQLAAHHTGRCSLLEYACREKPHSIAELVPVLFSHIVDPHQLGFAFGETHAHVNYLLRLGRLSVIPDENGISRLIVP